MISSFACSGRGGGVGILVHSPTVIATPIPIASSDEQLNVCAAYVSLLYGDEAPFLLFSMCFILHMQLLWFATFRSTQGACRGEELRLGTGFGDSSGTEDVG